MTDLPFQTAHALRAALRERRISARELLQATLDRLDRHDGALNAVVVRDLYGAWRDAALADEALARGDTRPLLGLPMTVKEAFDVAGLPTTWGLPGQVHHATQDAVAVARLRSAGAVIVGKTNVPVALADWQTANPLHGRTVNPWDATRTPGGSSGGSAAALAAGYVSLEVGTDLNGSLRVPAHCCGVLAHKPSLGIVPMRGTLPPQAPRLSVGNDHDLAVAGPMARDADDLALLLDVIAGPDDDRAAAWRLRLPPARHERLPDHRVLLLTDHPALPLAGDLRAVIEDFGAGLAAEGCTVLRRHAAMPELELIGRTFQRLLLGFIGADLPPADVAAIEAQVRGLPDDDHGPQAEALRSLVTSHRDWIAADRVRTGLRDAWRRLFAEVDLVVCPVWPTVAPPLDDTPAQRRLLDVDGRPVPYGLAGAWSALATLAGLPATVLPVGRTPSGLPVGVQAIGPALEDRTPLRFAALAARAFGGFVPPPGLA